MKSLRVCVIGAGAAGLCAARYLTSHQDTFNTTVFEQTSSVGGTWVYNERTGIDENGLPIHSSIYANLRTNLPKEVMSFPDFPFPPEWNSFMSHQQVLQYLQDYASHFSLKKFIHFNSAVTRVHPVKDFDSNNVKWNVLVEHVKTKESQSSIFDAVVICNGHFSVPSVPKIPGLDSFPGLTMHSHNYRHAEDFQQREVVLLGAGNSGQDIALQIAKHANMVYLSHKGRPLPGKLPENVEETVLISNVSEEGIVTFEDGQQRKVDAIVFCTGYKYSFPFLSPDCHIQVNNNRITHLYKHMFNTSYPSMSFVGLCLKTCPFPLCNLQARYIVSVLLGTSKLPSTEEMNADEDREFKEGLSSGQSQGYAHVLEGSTWQYCKDIAHLAGCEELSDVYSTLWNYVVTYRRKYFPMDYKNDEFKLTSDGTWAWR